MLRISKLNTLVFGLGLVLTIAVSIRSLPWSQEQPRAAADIRVAPEQFTRYVAEWSEQEGFFDSDNFISNETSYLHVIDELHDHVKPGGVYLGVGPDQNFSYIVHTRPVLAVIVDIRRQNMLQLLLFKALFKMASNRTEYLSLLFSREKPAAATGPSLKDLLSAVRMASTSEGRFNNNLLKLKDTLIEFKLNLSQEDVGRIEYVYRTFWQDSLDLRFSSLGRMNYLRYPRLEELLLESDRKGLQQNYLATEESFQWLKKFQAENRLIPVVGDFAGTHAFETVGAFLKKNGLRVSAFYTSNVEFYLFGRPLWLRYMSNLRALPVDKESVMIRSYFATYGRAHPENMPGHRSTSLVHEMKRFIDDYDAGAIHTYWDVVAR